MTDSTRRNVLKLLAVGLLGTVGRHEGVRQSGNRNQSSRHQKSTETTLNEAPTLALLAPLNIGSTLAGTKVLRIAGVEQGAVNIELAHPSGSQFTARIVARDNLPGAPTPIARTVHYELYLANGGKGSKPTDETQGLAVMALASIVQQNETGTPVLPLGTIRDRWRMTGCAQG